MPKKTLWDLRRRGENPEFLAMRAHTDECYDRADWHGAFKSAAATVAAFPWSVEARISRAALLGDWGELFLGWQRQERKAAALRELRYWVRTPPVHLTPDLKSYARNELYYHGGHWKAQAILGRARVKAGRVAANYGIGVGAACHGTELLRRGLYVPAQRWASVALDAWKTYYAAKPERDRFDTHCFLAIALAVLGRFNKAEAELATVQTLIGRNIRETSIYDIETRLAFCRQRLKGKSRGSEC